MLTLEDKLSYIFKNKTLLKQSLTHRSFGAHHNERLEFLGDAFLNISVAAWLYEQLSDQSEGVLTRARAALVKKDSLVEYATMLQLQDFLILGHGELKNHNSPGSVLADAFEALCGALFLDAGFDLAYKIFILNFHETLSDHLLESMQKDAKTLLQELAQKDYHCLPTYSLIEQTGASHKPFFTMQCLLASQSTIGSAFSKKQAELKAAQLMLEVIGKDIV